MKSHYLIAALICFFAPLFCHAQEEESVLRPVNSSWMLGVGSAHITDTYLTPLKYDGFNASLTYERMQAMKFNPRSWVQQLNIGVDFDKTDNPARNASMYYFALRGSWSMMWRHEIMWGITGGIGGQARLDAGAVYNARNGNNPVSVKADFTVGIEGYLTRSVNIGRMPVTFRWQSEIPVTGCFFSPEYDELYYEIYLGNHKNLAHAAWWGNFFRWDNLVTADLDFSGTRLRLGFQAGLLSTKVNNITSRFTNFSFVIGVTSDWFTVSRRKGLPKSDNPVIYSL